MQTTALAQEFFFQLALRGFSYFNSIALNPAPSLRELLVIALGENDSGWDQSDGPKETLADQFSALLVEKGPMLDEYFSIGVTDDGTLSTLPVRANSSFFCRLN